MKRPGVNGVELALWAGLVMAGCGGAQGGDTEGGSSTNGGTDVATASTLDPDTGPGTADETGAPPRCNPDNCRGCCDGDACVEGVDVSACGVGGGQCSACPDGSTCDAGVCDLPCEDTCEGCCEGETCIEFDAQLANTCGLGGAVCVACGVDFDCVEGACISPSCAQECDGCCSGAMCLEGNTSDACGAAGASCRACDQNSTCEAEGCVPDPMAPWDVSVIDGVIALTDPDGDPWDSFNGLPDPYVILEVVGASGETALEQDTIFPAWNAVVLEAVSTTQLQGGLTIEVWDSDLGLDTLLGSCSGDTLPLGGTGTVTCTAGADDTEVWSVTLSIEPSVGS